MFFGTDTKIVDISVEIHTFFAMIPQISLSVSYVNNKRYHPYQLMLDNIHQLWTLADEGGRYSALFLLSVL